MQLMKIRQKKLCSRLKEKNFSSYQDGTISFLPDFKKYGTNHDKTTN